MLQAVGESRKLFQGQRLASHGCRKANAFYGRYDGLLRIRNIR